MKVMIIFFIIYYSKLCLYIKMYNENNSTLYYLFNNFIIYFILLK